MDVGDAAVGRERHELGVVDDRERIARRFERGDIIVDSDSTENLLSISASTAETNSQGLAQPGGAVPWNDDRIDARRIGRAHAGPEVVRILYAIKDQKKQLVAALEALLEISPESAAAHYEIGRIHLKRGDLAGARGRIDQAIDETLALG